jgi:hypothetical protein
VLPKICERNFDHTTSYTSAVAPEQKNKTKTSQLQSCRRMSKASGGLGTPTSCKTDGSGGKKISQDSNWRKGWDSKPSDSVSFWCVNVHDRPVNKGDYACLIF